MYAHLTVFETLLLAAHFFLPETLSDENKKAVVNSVIQELGLIKAKDTIIGSDKVRGVSGGERKRASVAVQLISDPAVLFLDEPTSGLDGTGKMRSLDDVLTHSLSFSLSLSLSLSLSRFLLTAFQSQAIMECMKTLAEANRCVITVIHQPRSSIFDMFDKLLILSEGSTMYYGDAKGSIQHFAGLGFRCPHNFNPPDFFLDLLSPDNRSPENEVDSQNRIKFLAGEWKKTETSTEHQEMLLRSTSADKLSESAKIKSIGSTSSWKKTQRNFFLLCW
jgi:ABC-type multidrug transport system ATPase subunit